MQRSATSCFAKHIAAFLVRPFGEYPAFLVLTALLPLVPDIIRFFLNEMSFVPGRNLFYGTLLSLFRAWLLVLPLCLRQHDRGGEILAVRIAEAIYRVFVLSCLGLLSLAESFLLIRFGTPFSFSVIQLLWETDGRESLEFLKTYCTTPAFLLPAAACVLLTAGYLLAEHRKIRFELHSRKVRISLLFLLAGSGAFYVSRLHFQYALTRTGDFPGEMMRQTATLTPFERLHTSLFWFRHEFSAENAEQLLRTLESVEIESCSFRSPCIVIIIGESFSKHHSSLYGYPLPTNPRLEERLRRGELFVFRDVVSPANLTTSVLSNLFSPASLGSGQSWKDSPLFPALFKKAGYTTCHLDNQAAGNDYDYHDLGLKALFNARSTPLLFTVHNENRHPYDLELLDDYDRLTSRDDTPELVVFHLMGQHVSYSDRYPKEEAYFTPGDIRREDLTQQERPGRRGLRQRYPLQRPGRRCDPGTFYRPRRHRCLPLRPRRRGLRLPRFLLPLARPAAHPRGLQIPVRNPVYDLDVRHLPPQPPRCSGTGRRGARPAVLGGRPFPSIAGPGGYPMPMVRPGAQPDRRAFRHHPPPTAADGVRTRRKLRDHHRTRPKTIRLCHYPALDFHIFSYLCQR